MVSSAAIMICHRTTVKAARGRSPGRREHSDEDRGHRYRQCWLGARRLARQCRPRRDVRGPRRREGARIAEAAGGDLGPGSRRGGHRGADVVVLAVPSTAIADIADELAPVAAGKVIIDPTNPLTPDYSGLTTAGGPSGAERLAGLLPGAHVVKAFNTLFATVQANPGTHGTTVDTLFAPTTTRPPRRSAHSPRRSGSARSTSARWRPPASSSRSPSSTSGSSSSPVARGRPRWSWSRRPRRARRLTRTRH